MPDSYYQCRTRRDIATALAILLLSTPLTLAQPPAGDLDVSFGVGGRVTTDFLAQSQETGTEVVIQPDGKILEVGSGLSSPTSTVDFLLVRYNPDGSPDAGFGIGGKASADFRVNDNAFAVALQTDGKIVVAGYTFDDGTDTDFAVARFLSNGSLDSSFGIGGKTTTDFFGSIDAAFGVAIQPNGKMVLSGFAFLDCCRPVIALTRYNTNGLLDATFGTGGRVTTNITNFADESLAVALQTDGRIVVAGFSFGQVSGQHFALVRYNSSGSPDSNFGIGGIVTADLPNVLAPQARSLAIQPDGRILAGGTGLDPASNNRVVVLARYQTNGTLDGSFGNGGVDARFAGDYFEARDIAIQRNGKIVAAVRTASFGSDFFLFRYNRNGCLDPTFGAGGVVTTDFAGNTDVSNAVAIQPDGKIVAAGHSFNQNPGINGTFSLARYNGDSTDLDVCLQDDGNGNLLQFSSTTGDYQFTNCGSLILGGTGVVTRKGSSITLQQNGPDRRILATFDGGANRGTASIQLLSSGARFTITDRNTLNNTCTCGTTHTGVFR